MPPRASRKERLRAAFGRASCPDGAASLGTDELLRWYAGKLQRLGAVLRDYPECLSWLRQRSDPFGQFLLAAADQTPRAALRRRLEQLAADGSFLRFWLWLGVTGPALVGLIDGPAPPSPTAPAVAAPSPPTPPPPTPPRPKWDGQRRELRYGDRLCKRLRQRAANQEAILAAFEEEGWPPRIDDPLPPPRPGTPAQRLADAVRALNDNPHLRFERDGTGEGILWMPLADPP